MSSPKNSLETVNGLLSLDFLKIQNLTWLSDNFTQKFSEIFRLHLRSASLTLFVEEYSRLVVPTCTAKPDSVLSSLLLGKILVKVKVDRYA